MADRNDWERERMRDRGNESYRENWGRGREEDREREGQFTEGEERNRNWEREGRYGQGGYGHERRREFEGARDPYYSGSEGRWNEGRGYGGERGYEGSRGYDPTRAYEGSRGGYQGFRGAYEGSREDYGPSAFNRQFRGGPEYYGTGQRGYGTTWGGGGFGGPASYAGGQGAYGGGLGNYGGQGRFAGRGPRGYQRSDDRIREDVCERLTQHPDIDAVDIEIQVKNGEVTLTGTVEGRDAKRMAEDIAESISGVKDVHNQLRAQQGAMAGQASQGTKQETGGATAMKTK